MKAAAIALMLMVPGAGLAQEWWQGTWAAEAEWCAAADRIGSVTPAPISITQGEVLGYENSCAITGATRMDGVGAVHLTLQCQSEGDLYDEDRVIMRTDETGSTIWIWFGARDPILFQRCE